jgi:hypothetical protein
MMRLLIYTTLFPPLALIVYIVADQLLQEGVPDVGFLSWLLGIAYVLALGPAWLTAAVDWMLAKRSLALRLIITMAAAAFFAELVASYMGQPRFDWPVAFTGAIPAAVCSWLSARLMRAATA